MVVAGDRGMRGLGGARGGGRLATLLTGIPCDLWGEVVVEGMSKNCNFPETLRRCSCLNSNALLSITGVVLMK